ncbi:hypothetical protein DIURU_005203 [Diutina rugosa]|uniref:Uncharacterized protein n=1 Tax=Diutina rugosa TaxID=5481 RepID=A0A642UE76_DIURU|nr:uncharacterized protein DIURU_005203 [Diutina rugosa]KAA8897487.1 hypothetical protein DIURU_005203 [Diutina rugosa]
MAHTPSPSVEGAQLKPATEPAPAPAASAASPVVTTQNSSIPAPSGTASGSTTSSSAPVAVASGKPQENQSDKEIAAPASSTLFSDPTRKYAFPAAKTASKETTKDADTIKASESTSSQSPSTPSSSDDNGESVDTLKQRLMDLQLKVEQLSGKHVEVTTTAVPSTKSQPQLATPSSTSVEKSTQPQPQLNTATPMGKSSKPQPQTDAGKTSTTTSIFTKKPTTPVDSANSVPTTEKSNSAKSSSANATATASAPEESATLASSSSGKEKPQTQSSILTMPAKPALNFESFDKKWGTSGVSSTSGSSTHNANAVKPSSSNATPTTAAKPSSSNATPTTAAKPSSSNATPTTAAKPSSSTSTPTTAAKPLSSDAASTAIAGAFATLGPLGKEKSQSQTASATSSANTSIFSKKSGEPQSQTKSATPSTTPRWDFSFKSVDFTKQLHPNSATAPANTSIPTNNQSQPGSAAPALKFNVFNKTSGSSFAPATTEKSNTAKPSSGNVTSTAAASEKSGTPWQLGKDKTWTPDNDKPQSQAESASLKLNFDVFKKTSSQPYLPKAAADTGNSKEKSGTSAGSSSTGSTTNAAKSSAANATSTAAATNATAASGSSKLFGGVSATATNASADDKPYAFLPFSSPPFAKKDQPKPSSSTSVPPTASQNERSGSSAAPFEDWRIDIHHKVTRHQPQTTVGNASAWAAWFSATRHLLTVYEQDVEAHYFCWSMLLDTIPKEYTRGRSEAGSIMMQAISLEHHLKKYDERVAEANKIRQVVDDVLSQNGDVGAVIKALEAHQRQTQGVPFASATNTFFDKVNNGFAPSSFIPWVATEGGTSRAVIEYHNICANPQYKHLSFEEIRLKDYQSNRVVNVSSGRNDFRAFVPWVEKESNNGLVEFHNICAIPGYKHLSFEELRLKDYEVGRGGKAEFIKQGTSNTTNASGKQRPSTFGTSSEPKPSGSGGIFGGNNNVFGQQKPQESSSASKSSATPGSNVFGQANSNVANVPVQGSSGTTTFSNQQKASSTTGVFGRNQTSSASTPGTQPTTSGAAKATMPQASSASTTANAQQKFGFFGTHQSTLAQDHQSFLSGGTSFGQQRSSATTSSNLPPATGSFFGPRSSIFGSPSPSPSSANTGSSQQPGNPNNSSQQKTQGSSGLFGQPKSQ